MRTVRRVAEYALSPAVPGISILILSFVVGLRWLGSLSVPTDGTTAALDVFDVRLHVFVLAPIWFAACAVRSARESDEAALIRHGGKVRWMSSQFGVAAAESTQMILPVLLVAAVLAFATGDPAAGDNGGELVARVALYLLFLVAARVSFAALALVRSPLLPLAFFVLSIVLGVMVASGMPLPSVVVIASWLTWMDPGLTAAIIGARYFGAVVFAAWLLAMQLLVGLTTAGFHGVQQVVRVWTLPLIAFVGIALQCLLIGGAATVGAVSVLDAFGVIYYGPMVDMVGVPLIPVFLALMIFFGPAILMLRSFDDESGSWLDIVLIRAGSPARWVRGFLARWFGVAAAVLVTAPISTVIAWALLPDGLRATSAFSLDAGGMVFRHLVIGTLQVAFYLLVAFAFAWKTGRSGAGLAAIVVMMVGGIVNPLFGGWIPVYLNGLARVPFGWGGALRDTVILMLSITIVVLVLAASVRRVRRPTRTNQRRMTWLLSTSTT